jgi:hypothetical protein
MDSCIIIHFLSFRECFVSFLTLEEKPHFSTMFSTTFQLSFIVENITFNYIFFFATQMTLSTNFQNSQQCWINPATQLKTMYTCQFVG